MIGATSVEMLEARAERVLTVAEVVLLPSPEAPEHLSPSVFTVQMPRTAKVLAVAEVGERTMMYVLGPAGDMQSTPLRIMIVQAGEVLPEPPRAHLATWRHASGAILHAFELGAHS